MPKNKPWDQPGLGRAPTATRERRRILIVCEDSKSARYYFESFPVDKQRIEISVLGTGMNTDSLVKKAVKKKEQQAKNGQRYSGVWCVFDRDSFPLGNYSRAFQLAENNAIKIAWANEAFELWYLLHYCYLDASIGRAQYKKKLREMGLNYDKADKTIYKRVKHLQQKAIKNAARLEKHWNDSGKVFPERENPSTSVHKLVEYLNALADLGKVD
jgi:hypothetical protein